MDVTFLSKKFSGRSHNEPISVDVKSITSGVQGLNSELLSLPHAINPEYKEMYI
jgi:hypothetical protein